MTAAVTTVSATATLSVNPQKTSTSFQLAESIVGAPVGAAGVGIGGGVVPTPGGVGVGIGGVIVPTPGGVGVGIGGVLLISSS